MTTDERFDATVSRWLEETAPARLPERVLDATFERTRRSRQQVGWGALLGRSRMTPSALVLVRAAVVVMATALAVNLLVNQPRIGEPAPRPTTPEAWSKVVMGAPSGSRVQSLAAGPRGLLAVISEQDGDGPTRLVVSTDGHDWTTVPDDRHPGLWEQRLFGEIPVVGTDRGFLLLLGGDTWMSETGYDWQRLTSSGGDSEAGQLPKRAVAAGGPGLVAVGDGRAWYSTDGSDWSLAEVPPLPARILERPESRRVIELRGVAAAGDKLVAWGLASADSESLVVPLLWASSDGRSWIDVLDPQMGPLTAVAAGPGGFVASEGGRGFWFSADGESWERVAYDDFESRWPDHVNGEGVPVKLQVKALAGSDSGYVAVGGDGLCLFGPCLTAEAVIWTSADGRSWSRLPRDARFDGGWAEEAIAWGSRFVVGGTVDDRPTIWISGDVPTSEGGEVVPPVDEAAPTPAPTAEPTATGPVGDPSAAFAGTWKATDAPPDSSHLTMAIIALPDGSYDVTIRDDLASVCGGATSTMAGVAEPKGPNTLVIEQPDYVCDDGRRPKALSGPPLEMQLRGMRFVFDTGRDAIVDSLGLDWVRLEMAP